MERNLERTFFPILALIFQKLLLISLVNLLPLDKFSCRSELSGNLRFALINGNCQYHNFCGDWAVELQQLIKELPQLGSKDRTSLEPLTAAWTNKYQRGKVLAGFRS